MRHCLTPLDFSTQELDQLFDLAADIEKYPDKYAHACDGKKIATLFYEPSTRTRLSFEAAMMNLGGKALGFAGAAQSSAAKGESVADTIRVVSCFADIAAIRHNKEGAAYVASRFSDIPVSEVEAEYEKGGTPWCITYTFLPDELEGILKKYGVKNIALSGPGAYGRTLPREILVKIMNDPEQKADFLDFCYRYDSSPYVCGMGKDNLFAAGEI